MRILQLAPLWETVPPPAYGGTEYVVSLLTEELVRQGHDVTLMASGDSATSARLESVIPFSLRRATDLRDRNPYDWAHIGRAMELASRFDVVHNHAGELAMSMAAAVPVPMLTTAHCLTSDDTRFIWERYRGAYNTISRAQYNHFSDVTPKARYMGHVYNAVDVDSFPFQREKGDDLLFLSRVAPEKGPQLAVQVAKRLGMRLIIAGKVDDYDRTFFEEVMRGLIDNDQIVFFGEADATQKRALYASARCLLMPLTWEEPFGLAMAEANACGTPVIALRRGSAPEVVADGVSGFVVDTVEQMAEAVKDAGRIDPAACRAWVQRNFAPQAMAREYVRVYERLTERQRPVPAPRPSSATALSPTRVA